MSEPYAVRMTGGKKIYYQRKKDYLAGRARAKDAGRKRRKRILNS